MITMGNIASLAPVASTDIIKMYMRSNARVEWSDDFAYSTVVRPRWRTRFCSSNWLLQTGTKGQISQLLLS